MFDISALYIERERERGRGRGRGRERGSRRGRERERERERERLHNLSDLMKTKLFNVEVLKKTNCSAKFICP